MASYPENMSICDREKTSKSASLIPAGEVINTITHGIGTLLSLVGAAVLVRSAVSNGDVWRIIGCCIFASALIAVYAASTLSHAASESRLRKLFRTLDQGFIYLLIVGTYTPVAFAYLPGGGWSWFTLLMWTIALTGFCSKVFFGYRIESVAVWSYVLLGWLPVIPTVYLIGTVPTFGLALLLAGGFCYMIGTVFLLVDKTQLHFHAIWHVLVIAGSTCHFFAVLHFVAA